MVANMNDFRIRGKRFEQFHRRSPPDDVDRSVKVNEMNMMLAVQLGKLVHHAENIGF